MTDSAMPRLVILGLNDYVRQAWADGVRAPCLAYQLPGVIKIVWFGLSAKRLAHEWLHEAEPGLEHEPWYSCDLFSYNLIRVTDKHNAMARSAAWRDGLTK